MLQFNGKSVQKPLFDRYALIALYPPSSIVVHGERALSGYKKSSLRAEKVPCIPPLRVSAVAYGARVGEAWRPGSGLFLP